jgi:hypothetical protein
VTIPTEHPIDHEHEAALLVAASVCAKYALVVAQVESERDRYYRAACNGGFGNVPIKKQGRTFADLENLRNGGQ